MGEVRGMFRVNGRSIAAEKPGLCTIAELIIGEVLEELLTWKYFMEQHEMDIRPAEAMKHNAYKRINRRLKQIRHGM